MDNPDQTEVRRQMDRWREAVAARDLDRVMAFYVQGNEFLGFDFVPPFMFSGTDAFRAEWDATFKMLDDDPTFELRDMTIQCSGDLAVAYGLSHFQGTMGKTPIDIWTRQTNAFRKVGGQWLLIHEHVSVPIDIKSMKGVVDFRP